MDPMDPKAGRVSAVCSPGPHQLGARELAVGEGLHSKYGWRWSPNLSSK